MNEFVRRLLYQPPYMLDQIKVSVLMIYPPAVEWREKRWLWLSGSRSILSAIMHKHDYSAVSDSSCSRVTITHRANRWERHFGEVFGVKFEFVWRHQTLFCLLLLPSRNQWIPWQFYNGISLCFLISSYLPDGLCSASASRPVIMQAGHIMLVRVTPCTLEDTNWCYSLASARLAI